MIMNPNSDNFRFSVFRSRPGRVIRETHDTVIGVTCLLSSHVKQTNKQSRVHTYTDPPSNNELLYNDTTHIS